MASELSVTAVPVTAVVVVSANPVAAMIVRVTESSGDAPGTRVFRDRTDWSGRRDSKVKPR